MSNIQNNKSKKTVEQSRSSNKKSNKNKLPKFNKVAAVVTMVLTAFFGYIVFRYADAAAHPTGEDAYESTASTVSSETTIGLRKVKASADHPCAGTYEVEGKLDADGDKICTYPSDKLNATLSTEKNKQLQEKSVKILSQSSQQFVDGVKVANGNPPADAVLKGDPVISSAAGSLDGQGASPIVPTQPSCYGTGMDGRRIVVIAAGTPDKPITESDKQIIRTSVQQMESILIWNTQQQNEANILHFRFMQGADCQPLIFTANQNKDYFNDLSVFTFASLKQDQGILAAANQAKKMANGQGLIPHFLVFTRSGGGACGQSDFAVGGGYENSEAYSFVYGRTTTDPSGGTSCWNGFTATHEAFHALGAVDFTAPHTTLFGHCYDEYDLMCYDDRGVSMQIKCQNTQYDGWATNYLLDCGADDYFSVKTNANAVFNPNWLLGQTGLVHYNTAKSGFMTNKVAQTGLNSPPPSSTVTTTVTTTNPTTTVTTNTPTSTTNSTPSSVVSPIPTTDPSPVPTILDNIAPSVPGKITRGFGFDSIAFSYYIDLSWTKSSDNVGVTRYIVKRNGSEVGKPIKNAFRDYKLRPNVFYNYEISAQDASGNTSSVSKTSAVGRCFLIWCWLQ